MLRRIDDLSGAAAPLQIPPAQSGNQAQQHGGVLPHPRRLGQLLGGGVQHPGQGAEAVNQRVGQTVHISLGDCIKQQQLQTAVVGPPLQPPGQKLGFHPLPVPGVEIFWFSRHRGPSLPKVRAAVSRASDCHRR